MSAKPKPSESMEFSNNLNDYIIKDMIGKGTFGCVYKGIHKPNNLKVAIKIIDFEKLKQTKNGISRIKTEIEIQSKLNHDGIIKLYQSFIHIDNNDNDNNNDKKIKKSYILILEYSNGGTLNNYLKQQKCGKLSESHCYEIFIQLVEILRYLHENQIIHRDLKLSNILIYKNRKRKSRKSRKNIMIKLCDFGLSTKTSLSPDRYTMCGTPNYCAPEIAKHQKHGYLVDVWSLGIILFTLLIGSPPFHTGDTKQTLNKIINHKKINIPNYLSNPAKLLIKKLLNKEPKQRINTNDILDQIWIKRKGKSLNIINIKYLKSMKKYLKKLNVTVEILQNQSCKIWWNDNQFYMEIFGDDRIYIFDVNKNIKKEYDINCLPVIYYKLHDILSSFIGIISTQTPMIALFINNNIEYGNKYRFKRIILLHNKDIDFTFSSLFIHYSFKANLFECVSFKNNEKFIIQISDKNENDHDDERIKLCQDLISRIHSMYDQYESYPVELKYDLNTNIAIYHHKEGNEWKYYLPNNMICTRTRNGKSNEIFQFEDNKEISIIIQGKNSPFIIEKFNENHKIEITSQKGSSYNKYWKCMTKVLQI